ncbi:PAS domain S-box protein [Caulobacter sp. RL271]|uniref:histidine kinase n=1 Tax=Caulobacter segnis TaxID=88688 RepID=A0ABY5A1W8_9CAUL|nr:PAS domain S-box protein [Caulobacter segnis]USQ98247.1 PAS domain S-box protein [Caulobacter segnis]
MSDLDKLQPILNTAIDAVVVMDARGLIVDWSRRAQAMFGWARSEVLGRPLGDVIIPPPLRQAHQRGLDRFVATKISSVQGQLLELSALRRDGEAFPVELSITTWGSDEDPLFLGFLRDISERRDAVVKLAASEARFRAAVDAVEGVLWTNNAAGEMIGAQPGWEKLTGQSQAEYQGFGWAQTVHPDDAQPTIEAWLAAVAERRPFIFEHRVRRHDGAWRTFQIRAVPVLEADDTVREWVGVHTDVTEQKTTEARLRVSEARFRAMADAAPSPVWMTTAEGGVEFVNQAFAEFAGLDRDGLLGNVWINLIHPDDIGEVLARRIEARATLASYSFEARFRAADTGSYRWMLANARPRFDEVGQFIGYLGMAMDLTAIKEAQIHQRLLINELNHRVKNTLAAIQSIVRQTLKPGETPPQVREKLFERLMAMSAAHDVLTRENWSSAGVEEVVRQAVRPFIDNGDTARIMLAGPPLRVGPSAALALALALHELGTNAVKYGALSVPAGVVRIEWSWTASGQAQLLWRETGGPGVAPPAHRGFGARLLSGGLASDLGGRPELIFAPEGVEARLTLRVEGAGSEYG